MIDYFQTVARAIRGLRLPSVAVGLLSLMVIVVTIFTSKSNAGDRFLVPGIVGLLWAMSTYAFIALFESVPKKASRTMSFFGKLKHNIYRGCYWLLGIAFLFAVIASVFVSVRMILMWLRDYG